MGGRSSKVTVSNTGEGGSVATDAALLKALASEYASAKQNRTGSGRIAWELKDCATRSKERNSEEVYLVDRDRESLSSQAAAGGRASPTSLSDTKIGTQPHSGADDRACAREAGASSTASPSAGLHHVRQQHQQHQQPAAGENKASPGSLAATHSQAKPPPPVVGAGCAGPAADQAPKYKRPATGNPKNPQGKHNGNNADMPSPRTAAAQQAATAAVTAVAVTAAGAAIAACESGAANASRPMPAPAAAAAATAMAQPKPGGGADPVAAGCGGGGGASSGAGPGGDSAVAAAAAAHVHWVIRPGPPIESVYKLGKVLGEGSFGVVRAATHLATGAEVAVKTIRKAQLRSADVASLRREVEILHHLSGHPHISQLLGVYEEPRQLHLVLELYKGGDLFDAIIGVGRHSERTAADVLRTVMTAIGYCHAMGVAHRDIKPENFMLTADLPKDFKPQQQPPQQPPQQQQCAGSKQIPLAPPIIGIGSRLKLIDFGLSAFCTDDTPLTEIVGTSYYVAPEVLEGRYSLPADVWSAGVILHIMLTGYAPFDGKDDREILRAVRKGKLDLTVDPVWRSISSEAAAVLTAMLERDPKKRATADQVLSMPWLGRTAEACEAPSAPLPGVVSERMARFARMSSFKKEARRVVAGLMRPEEVAGLVEQFRGLDTDRDGRISLAELRDGMARQMLLRRGSQGCPAPLSEEQLRELLRRSDLNGDGLLDESEFLGAAVPAAALARQALAGGGASRPASGSAGGIRAAQRQPSAIMAAFKHFDVDGSGYITIDELRRALAAHHPSGKGLDFEALLSRHDRDADGRISYPEFVDMLVQDIEDDEDDMYDTAVQCRTGREEHRLTPTSAGGGVRLGAAGAIDCGHAAGRAVSKSRDSSTAAWGVGEREPSSATAASSVAAVRGRGSRAVSRSSTAAAQLPSGRMSPLEWSDECVDSDDEEAAASAAGTASAAIRGQGASHMAATTAAGALPDPAALTALAAARASAGSGGVGANANAPRIMSRFSQPLMQVQPPTLTPPTLTPPPASSDTSASAPIPRIAGRSGSISGVNRRGSIGGCGPPLSDASYFAAGGGGLYRLPEAQDNAASNAGAFGGASGAAAAAAAASAAAAPRAGQRPPPPRLQLPAQPAADMRSRRHSAGGVLQYDRTMIAAAAGTGSDGGSSGGGASPMHQVESRAAAASRRCYPGTPTDRGPSYNFADLHGGARGGGGAAAAVSLPGSPSAAAAAAAQRVAASRGSTSSAPQQPLPSTPTAAQQYRAPPLQMPLGSTLPALQAPLGSPSGIERLSDRASCPQNGGGWPLSPGGGGSAAAAWPTRASATGMLPVRNPQPCLPAGAAAAATSAAAPTATGVAASFVANGVAASLRPAPPSEPLPVLQTAGLRSRRQSTGSPAWPLSTAGAAAGAPATTAAQTGYPAHNSQPLYQLPQSRHNYSVSCSGGAAAAAVACGYGTTVSNALSPRVPAVTPEWGAAATPAGRRSRRATQPGMLPTAAAAAAGGEDLLLTARMSIDVDASGAPRGFPLSGASAVSEEDARMRHVLPPGATGLGFGAPYTTPHRALMTSGSGRLL